MEACGDFLGDWICLLFSYASDILSDSLFVSGSNDIRLSGLWHYPFFSTTDAIGYFRSHSGKCCGCSTLADLVAAACNSHDLASALVTKKRNIWKDFGVYLRRIAVAIWYCSQFAGDGVLIAIRNAEMLHFGRSSLFFCLKGAKKSKKGWQFDDFMLWLSYNLS